MVCEPFMYCWIWFASVFLRIFPLFKKILSFNWRKIALQCCIGFCHTRIQISYNYIHMTSSWTSLPCPPPPSRSSQSRTSPCYVAISYQLSILHMVVYICQGYFLHCPTLSLPHCIHKSVSASVSSFLHCE